MPRPLGVLVVPVVLALAGTARAQPAGPGTERIEARDGSVVQAELGRLEVSERRGAKGTRVITLAWMRIRSEAAEPGPPVVLLAGGPGGSAIEQLRRHASGGGAGWRGLMGGDIVALDQRGVGLSQPNLDSETSFELPLDVPGDPEALLAAICKVSQAEAARWRAQPAADPSRALPKEAPVAGDRGESACRRRACNEEPARMTRLPHRMTSSTGC